MSDHEAMEDRIDAYNERTDPARGGINLEPLRRFRQFRELEEQVKYWQTEARRLLEGKVAMELNAAQLLEAARRRAAQAEQDLALSVRQTSAMIARAVEAEQDRDHAREQLDGFKDVYWTVEAELAESKEAASLAKSALERERIVAKGWQDLATSKEQERDAARQERDQLQLRMEVLEAVWRAASDLCQAASTAAGDHNSIAPEYWDALWWALNAAREGEHGQD